MGDVSIYMYIPIYIYIFSIVSVIYLMIRHLPPFDASSLKDLGFRVLGL